MNDVINNRLDSYRTRLACLDKPDHAAVWSGQPPLKFTEKAAAVRAAIAELAEMAGQQSAPTTGSAAEKKKEETELETAAYRLGRAVVNHCADTGDLVTAAKYDVPLSGWRRLRDEALVQKARQLEADATAVAALPGAAGYGITPAAVAAFQAEADDYEALVAAPRDVIADRSTLTAALNPGTRAIAALFDQMDDLALQFAGTPAGNAFLAAWFASGSIIQRGSGPSPEPETPPAPVPAG